MTDISGATRAGSVGGAWDTAREDGARAERRTTREPSFDGTRALANDAHLIEFARNTAERLRQRAEVDLATIGRGGLSSSASATSTYPDAASADAAFHAQAARLADVNQWNELSGRENATFALYDATGNAASGRSAAVGDFVRIRLPGQPNADWVRIEKVDASADKAEIVVRPSYDPTKSPLTPSIVAHFFTDKATNTFSVARRGTTVEARVDGRDESANVGASSGGLAASARNRAVAEGAWGLQVGVPGTKMQINGLQQHQWNRFTESLAKVTK